MEEGRGHGVLPWTDHHGSPGPLEIAVESRAADYSVKTLSKFILSENSMCDRCHHL